MYTIELNLDDDFANACAYHVDDEESTYKRNLRAALDKTEVDRWVYIGAAHTLSDALDKCDKIRKVMCEMSGKKPYGIEWSL